MAPESCLFTREVKHIFYLGGDSYPTDAGVETLIADAFGSFFNLKVVRQSDLLIGCSDDWRAIPSRVAHLRDHLDGLVGHALLIGRSSGARVVSMLANHPSVGAVICLAYPFQHPYEGVDVERYKHLPATVTPMMIIQGFNDPYGGEGLVSKYQLPDSIQVKYVDTNHEMMLAPEAWDEVVASMMAFSKSALQLQLPSSHVTQRPA